MEHTPQELRREPVALCERTERVRDETRGLEEHRRERCVVETETETDGALASHEFYIRFVNRL